MTFLGLYTRIYLRRKDLIKKQIMSSWEIQRYSIMLEVDTYDNVSRVLKEEIMKFDR